MIKIRHHDTLRRLDFKHPATWVATWFGTGLMHLAQAHGAQSARSPSVSSL